MKICSKCKIEKDLSEFNKDKSRKDSYSYVCKKCDNKYNKKWYEKNKEKKLKQNRKYNEKYNNDKANYDTYALQISWANDPVRNIDGFLQVKCTYCGKWCFPTIKSIKNRIRALNGKGSSKWQENRLYCSKECKEACPIYHKILFQEGHPLKNQNSSREVQPELRQMVFERDGYACIKCGKHQDNLNVPLHCHHIEGILWNPLESADIDMCVTVCKICHNEIHQEDGCGYNDMKCKGENKCESCGLQ